MDDYEIEYLKEQVSDLKSDVSHLEYQIEEFKNRFQELEDFLVKQEIIKVD